MSNLEEEQQVQEENSYWVGMWNALQRLEDNKDFQKIILQGYFKDKAVDGVSMLAQDAVIARGERSAIMEDLIAISSLQDFFIMIGNLGNIPPEPEDEDDV